MGSIYFGEQFAGFRASEPSCVTPSLGRWAVAGWGFVFFYFIYIRFGSVPASYARLADPVGNTRGIRHVRFVPVARLLLGTMTVEWARSIRSSFLDLGLLSQCIPH
jgi:hypothetical protein